MADKCPTCMRPFEKMLDYPLILVRAVEVHPVSEVIDFLSEEALVAKIRQEHTIEGEPQGRTLPLQGINRTPEIAALYELELVQKYLDALKNQRGKTVQPRELLPTIDADKYFPGAYPLPGTKLYLTLSEAKARRAERICQIMCCCNGPNLGSAGGPTLQHLAPLASIHYEGRHAAMR